MQVRIKLPYGCNHWMLTHDSRFLQHRIIETKTGEYTVPVETLDELEEVLDYTGLRNLSYDGRVLTLFAPVERKPWE